MASNDYYGTHIAMWYDHAWIVSREDKDSSETLHTFPRSARRAQAAAIREGRDRNLAVYYTWPAGPAIHEGQKQCFECAARYGHYPTCKFAPSGRPNKDGVI